MSLAKDIASAIGDLFAVRLVTTRIDVVTSRIQVPGIVTGAAYAALDTFGQLMVFDNVARTPGGSFVIATARFYDYDNEGISKTVFLFSERVTIPADNAAWALADSGMQRATESYLGKLSFTSFDDHINGQVSVISPNLYLQCAPTDTAIYAAIRTQGADNTAAGAIPELELTIARD